MAGFALEFVGSSDYDFLTGTGRLPAAIVVGGLIPEAINHGQLWRLLTSAFLHASIIHLGLNLVGLVLVGWFLESRYGATRMMAIYLAAILGADLFQYIAYVGQGTVAIGASGGIVGLFAAAVVLAVRYWLWRDDLSWAVGALVATLLGGLGHRGVSTAGHLGGLAAGFAAAWLVDVRPELRHEMLSREAHLVQVSAARLSVEEKHLPSAHVIEDPNNRLVLPLGGRRKALVLGSACFFLAIGLGAALNLINDVSRGTASAFEIAYTVVAGAMGLIGLAILRALDARLVLTPLGFFQQTAFGHRLIRWIDIDYIGTMTISHVNYVSLRLNPAAVQALPNRLMRFMSSGTLMIQLYGGLKASELAGLLEEWRGRWSPEIG